MKPGGGGLMISLRFVAFAKKWCGIAGAVSAPAMPRGPCPPFRPVFGDGEQSATVDSAHPSHPPLKSIVFRGLHIGMRVSASHNSTCYSGARASVVDGSSPNNDLYAPAKYPNCQKPYREATCVTVAAS